MRRPVFLTIALAATAVTGFAQTRTSEPHRLPGSFLQRPGPRDPL